MTKNEFKSRLTLIGYNQTKYAKRLKISNNTISTMLNLPRIPEIHKLALVGLEAEYKANK